MAEHSPAPFDAYQDDWDLIVEDKNGRVIGRLRLGGKSNLAIPDEMQVANACLFAAAPEMLAALRQFERWDTDPHGTEADAASLRRAIATAIEKATNP